MREPAWPIYVISKGRAQNQLTAQMLAADGLAFHVVIEPPERAAYAANPYVGEERLLELPFHDLGLGGIPARNWCWEHARAAGHSWHWILDDNISRTQERLTGRRRTCPPRDVFLALEQLALAGTISNLAIIGPAYSMFCGEAQSRMPVMRINAHVYSWLGIRCDLPFRWRGRYNEDTDLCLRTIASGRRTCQVTAYCVKKIRSMVMKGGNTDVLYAGDGRLRMARSLERMWPGVVSTHRRYGRPQHVVDWRKLRP